MRALCAVAFISAMPLFGQTVTRVPAAEAAGCVVSTLACNTNQAGEIAVGDCAFSDGTRYDRWTFVGTADQLVTITLTTMDASYTLPVLEMIPPFGDSSKVPAVAGASPLVMRYRLSSSGTWTIYVETGNLADAGRYTLSLSCGSADLTTPQNCVTQKLRCGQSFDWSLTATSCQFSGGKAYAYFEIRMFAGDTVRYAAHSDYFDPALSVYRRGGQPVATGFGKQFSKDAEVTFTAPATDNYQIAVYNGTGAAGGTFFVLAQCIAVCGAPTITVQPSDAHVPFGGSVTLYVGASSTGPITYGWHYADDPLSSLQSGQALQLTGITKTASYFAVAASDCGSTNSRVATVTVDCTAPQISAQPQGATIKSGETVLLTVVALGQAPMSYRWYEGASGDVSRPTSGTTNTYAITNPANGQRFWVRVTNECGSADSATATITVLQPPRRRAAGR